MRNAVSEDAPAREKSGLAGWRVSAYASTWTTTRAAGYEDPIRLASALVLRSSLAPHSQSLGD